MKTSALKVVKIQLDWAIWWCIHDDGISNITPVFIWYQIDLAVSRVSLPAGSEIKNSKDFVCACVNKIKTVTLLHKHSLLLTLKTYRYLVEGDQSTFWNFQKIYLGFTLRKCRNPWFKSCACECVCVCVKPEHRWGCEAATENSQH